MGGHLAARSLMQVSGCLALAGATAGLVSCEVHMVPHLN